MSNNALNTYYKWHAPIYDATRWVFLLGRKKLVRTILSLQKTSPILELGCGTGWLLNRCLKNDPTNDYVGIDLSKEMINKSKYRLKKFKNIQLINESIINYQEQKKFKIIYASYSITMMHGIFGELLPKLNQLLTDNGRLFILDFYRSPVKLFEKWMGLNHVTFLDKTLAEFETHFEIINMTKMKVYFGLWEYAQIELKPKK